MKKKLLGLITCLSILISTSCTQTSPGGSNTGGGSLQTSWSCDINGVNYSWSGVHPISGTNDGLSTFTATTGTNPYANLMFCSPSFAGNRKIIRILKILWLWNFTCNLPTNFREIPVKKIRKSFSVSVS